MPYFFIEELRLEKNDNDLIKMIESMQSIDVFEIVNGELRASTTLSDNAIKKIKSGCEKRKLPSVNGYSAIPYRYKLTLLTIKNVGNGPAIGIRFSLQKKDCKVHKRSVVHSVEKGQGLPVLIYLDDYGSESKNLGEYVLKATFEDIYGDLYEQTSNIVFSTDKNKDGVYTEIDMKMGQKLIKLG